MRLKSDRNLSGKLVSAPHAPRDPDVKIIRPISNINANKQPRNSPIAAQEEPLNLAYIYFLLTLFVFLLFSILYMIRKCVLWKIR
jgi:hypothetical protein